MVSTSFEHNHIQGFGEFQISHQLPRALKKGHIIAISILLGKLALSAIIVTSVVMISPLFTGIMATCTVALTSGFFAFIIKSTLNYLKFRKGPCTCSLGLNTHSLGKYSHGNRALICHDTTQATDWKMKLIEEAKHSIILSGCYCGGQIFDIALEKMELHLKNNNLFQIFLLTSDIFLTKNNIQKLKKLSQKYPINFHYVVTPVIIYAGPSIKVTSNHTKALVIDGGQYSMIGGSGLQDLSANYTGTDPIEQKKRFLPTAYRDKDVVIECSDPNGFGRSLHNELLKLYARWRHFNHPTGKLEKNLNFSIPIYSRESLLENAYNTKIKIFPSGPEHRSSPYLSKLMQYIDNAKNDIYIEHMYFHPPKKLLQKLINASNRGVKITLVTNLNTKNSPQTHHLFGTRTLYNIVKLCEGKQKENVKCYVYKVPHTTLHTKMLIIDRKLVTFGSGNLGTKTLKTFSDYEIHAVAKSKNLANEAIRSIENDIKYSKLIKTRKLTTLQKARAKFQEMLGPLLG